MARNYAVGPIAGLKGQVVTSVGGEIVAPGTEFYRGLTSFDVTYWYNPTAADIANGATPGKRTRLAIQNIPVTATDAEIRDAVMKARQQIRESQTWGYPNAKTWDGT